MIIIDFDLLNFVHTRLQFIWEHTICFHFSFLFYPCEMMGGRVGGGQDEEERRRCYYFYYDGLTSSLPFELYVRIVLGWNVEIVLNCF